MDYGLEVQRRAPISLGFHLSVHLAVHMLFDMHFRAASKLLFSLITYCLINEISKNCEKMLRISQSPR